MYALPATPGTAHLHLAAAHSGTHLNPWQLLALPLLAWRYRL
jgi:hypothetical protein